jgi:uncharacterized protein with ParB-like and HNH nuclease domain
MAITPKQKTVEELFGTKKYYADFYQREYKWNDAQQAYRPVKSLLDDIFYRFDLKYKPDMDISEEAISKYDWYYLNSYMTNTVGGKTYIVDGQQRLTTLSILIICLHKMGQKLGVAANVLRFIEMKICSYDAHGNHVYWMGFDDRINAFTAIHNLDEDGKPVGEFKSISERNIREAWKTINDYLAARLTTVHLFDAFRLYLLKRVILIEIDVDEPKDVAMAFEVINDRGVPLSAYEILKGKVLGIIDKEEVSRYVDCWESAINPIADTYGDSDVDYFLRTYFQSKYADTLQQYRELHNDYHKTIYLDEYDKRIGFKIGGASGAKCIANIKAFVKETLPFYSDLFCELYRESTDSGNVTNSSYSWFNQINEQDYQYYLTFAAISVNDADIEHKYKLVTREFDRLYTLLNLTGSYKSNELSAAVILLGKVIRNRSADEIKAAFDATLLDMIKKAHDREDITNPLKYELFANTGYLTLGKRFMRYFFARIDHLISNEAGLPTGTYYSLVSQARGKDVYHVEHILANDDNFHNLSLFSDEEHFSIQRNRLGGLVLLKGPDNQSSGNELYKNKLKTYSGNGTIFAQTLLPDFNHSNTGFKRFMQKYGLEFKTYQEFDATAIEERQRLLFEMVKIIWA